MQEEVLKRLRQQHDKGEDGNAEKEVVENLFLATAMMHNMAAENRGREWIPVEDRLLGPAHIAKLLIWKIQERRSTPERLYRVNVKQLDALPCSCRRSNKDLRNEKI